MVWAALEIRSCLPQFCLMSGLSRNHHPALASDRAICQNHFPTLPDAQTSILEIGSHESAHTFCTTTLIQTQLGLLSRALFPKLWVPRGMADLALDFFRTRALRLLSILSSFLLLTRWVRLIRLRFRTRKLHIFWLYDSTLIGGSSCTLGGDVTLSRQTFFRLHGWARRGRWCWR